MEKYLFSSEEQALMEGMQIPFAIYQYINKRVVTLVLSDGFCKLFGFENREKAYRGMDHDIYRDIHPDDIARISDAAFRFAEAGDRYEIIYRVKDSGGSGYRIIHAKGEHIYSKEGVRLAQVWYTDEGDFSQDQEFEATGLNRVLNKALYQESMLQANYFDDLTGLPSMTYFFELAKTGKKEIFEQGGTPAILFMDLVGLHYFNRKHGFAEGSRLLQVFARLLGQTFGSENCSRFAKDQFGVFLDGNGVELKLEHFFQRCQNVTEIEMLPVRVGIFIGAEDDRDISSECDFAKLACDSLGNISVSEYRFFDAELQVESEYRRYIIENLDRALEEHWVCVYYQPIVRALNGRVCDEEALARWIDPEKGFLSPGDFIPILEEENLIYRLDLYMLDEVLKKLKLQESAGLTVVPQSVNLSRTDFDCCDIVEEIRKRVDAAGIGRDKITIELTESAIGRDFDFIKKQIERFKELGFPVWLDDFGSGYSSLDVLQSISFDLIKFDMRFMQRLNSEERSRIVLTELMKMATSLGVDTVCEGVETREQMRFLQEIGCSKLQGYYFTKPLPMSEVFKRYETHTQIGFEDPEEENYYDTIGKVNLYDLSVMANEDESSFENYFSSLPMAIIEVKGREVRFIRSNQPYRDFVRRHFGSEMGESAMEFSENHYGMGPAFMNMLDQCCQSGQRAFIDDSMPDGTKIHSFLKRIAENPVKKTFAVGLVVLSILDSESGTTYENIARALTADYFNIFYVDLKTDSFIEYTSSVGEEAVNMERHGEDFFGQSQRDAKKLIYEEDYENFVEVFTKDNVLHLLDETGTFAVSYRLKNDGNPIYVLMKAMRMDPDGRYLIIGVSNVDAQKRQMEALNRIRQEQVSYNRIMALAGDYIALYTVDLETGHYVEYRGSEDYDDLGIAKEGEKFFETSRVNGEKLIFRDDLPMYQAAFRKEKVLAEIENNGAFRFKYRLLINGVPTAVSLKAVVVKESDGDKLIIGVNGHQQ